MKFYIIVVAFLFFYSTLFAQEKGPNNDACSCIISINLRSLNYSDEDSVTDQLIVEIDIDSNCKYSNPVLVKRAGDNRNKAALEYANQYIDAMNRCKCPCPNHSKRKKELPIKFISEVVD